MEFGVYHEFHCRPGEDPATAFAYALQQVDWAEEWGLDAIWLAEIHQQARRSLMSVPMTVAAAIAARTKRIKIGTAVQVLPLCHPLRLAEEGATVDLISRGRLLFGVGRSGNPRSYRAYGVDYAQSRERFFETLEIVKLAWTQPSFSYDGKYWHFDNAAAVPSPVQKPYPPIRIAGASEDTFPVLGAAGYPIFVAVRSGSLEGLAPDLAAYRTAWKAAGHPGNGEVYLRLTLHIGDTDAAARAEAEDSIMVGYRTLSTRLEGAPNRRRAAEAEAMKTITYDEVMRDKVIIGSPDTVARRLQQLHDGLGLDGILAELNFGALVPPETMTHSLRLLCQEVMPRFRALQSQPRPAGMAMPNAAIVAPAVAAAGAGARPAR
jgi:alkanesulfonate monooxygenase SsuD/methylene tetrahydromethanopterin reductase-like flavin-dependent oxidoreductase (luciferase family)